MLSKVTLIAACFVAGGVLFVGCNWNSRLWESNDTLKPITNTEPRLKYQDVPPKKTRDEYMSFNDMNALSAVIQQWKKGDPVPLQLVSFPHYKGMHRCGIGAQGQDIEDYVREITDEELLKAMILEPKTDDAAFNAALGNLIRNRALRDSAALTTALLKEQPGLVGRTAFSVALKDLSSPCLLLKIARYDKDRPVTVDTAREVMKLMQKELEDGNAWKVAYGKASETMKDEKDHKPDQAFWGPTHLSYVFDGSATPEYRDLLYGFNLRTYQYASIPNGHLEILFKAKGGTHILETGKAIWLYHLEEYFAGTAK